MTHIDSEESVRPARIIQKKGKYRSTSSNLFKSPKNSTVFSDAIVSRFTVDSFTKFVAFAEFAEATWTVPFAHWRNVYDERAT